MFRGPRRRTRRGSAAVYALLALPLLFVVFVGVMRVAFIRLDKTEMQTAVDAAALAGVNVLADTDAILTDHPPSLRRAVGEGREAAVQAAGLNLVRGAPVALDPDDIEFGRLRPGHPFEPLEREDGSVLRGVNAVRVSASGAVGKRDTLRVQAVAVLDFGVVGLRPVTDRPVPLVPLAVLGDPSGRHPRALEAQPRRDRHRPKSEGKGWVPGQDGIPEVTILLGPAGANEPGAVAWSLRLGGGKLADQLTAGVAADDLDAWTDGFRADAPGGLQVPAGPQPHELDSAAFARTVVALRHLRQEAAPRVWPVGQPGVNGKVTVTGFFGARVVEVEGDPGARRVRVVLQPAVFATPTAVTAAGSTLPPPFDRTVCRARLAE